MKVNLVGYRNLSFKSKEKGTQVSGQQLLVSHQQEDVTGLWADKLFIENCNKSIILINLNEFVGQTIDIEYGYGGSIECISA